MLTLKWSKSAKGYSLMVVASIFYGFMGLFVQFLSGFNIPSTIIAFYNPFIAFLVIFIYLIIWKREYLKLDAGILVYVILLGLVSQTISNQFYIAAIAKTTMSTAVVLNYTAPIFVVIMARFLYKELFTLPKIIALVVSLTGCFLTATGGSLEVLKLNAVGVLLGIASGISFAFLPIITKKLVGRCHYLTIACYTMAFGALFNFFLAGPRAIVSINYTRDIWVNLIGLGVVANALGYLLYTKGMAYGIQSSKASIINTIEVPVAALVSFIFFQEDIFGVKLVGIILVVLSVVIIEYGDRWIAKRKEIRT